MSDWIKTDDLQFLRKTGEKEYELAEVRYGCYIVQGNVTVPDLSDSTIIEDVYEDYIRYYYSSLQEFMESYPEKEEQEQVLAEIIFELTPVVEMQYRIVQEKAEEVLFQICSN